jgi:hypothetical protein
VFAEVEDAGGEDGVGVAVGKDGDHVVEVAGSAAGDDGDGDGVADGAGESDVVAGFRRLRGWRLRGPMRRRRVPWVYGRRG